ncbi:hypothetical protein VCR14J2_80004 [Vibrio coralliirubri]|nr:hypothetical protein VCR14J2_80004 [Vibrio coralliirubri]
MHLKSYSCQIITGVRNDVVHSHGVGFGEHLGYRLRGVFYANYSTDVRKTII